MATATKTIQRLRNFLMGKEYNIAVRYPHELQKRTLPDPNLPGGFAHKLSDNYYGLTRDTRRDHGPPTVMRSTVLQISGESGSTTAAEKLKVAAPGDVLSIS